MMYVYAIAGAGLVKIGQSKHPEIRRADLQLSSPVPLELLGYSSNTQPMWPSVEALVPTSIDREHAIHRRLKKHRHHGEWFDTAVHTYIRQTLAYGVAFPLLMQSLVYDDRLNFEALQLLGREDDLHRYVAHVLSERPRVPQRRASRL